MSTPTAIPGIHLDTHPEDGRDWDCLCARCGSSVDWEPCTTCGGEGVDGHYCGEDCCCCLYPDDNMPCDLCDGEGGFRVCISSPEWCQANPLPGRESIERGRIEWFPVEEAEDRFIEESARHCECQPPHDRPCAGVLAGAGCDGMGLEPDFTKDDLDWSEEET